MPLFRSGFAGTTRLTPAEGASFHGPRDQYEDVRGIDSNVPSPHDWEDFGRHPNLGSFRIYYEDGDESQRFARILSDADDPTKRFLRFWIGRPNVSINWSDGVEHKARVQTELYGNTGLHEVFQSVRVRLHPSLAVLQDMQGTIDWLTLAEFWNQPFWEAQHTFPFRISFSIVKRDAARGAPLFFGAHAQTKIGEQKFDTLWDVTGRDMQLAFGTWMTIEIYYKEGDRNDGRFYVAVTPDGGSRQVLFDVHDWTHHPDNPSPKGLTHYNPMKLYTSAGLVDFVRQAGGTLEIDWSDFSIWQARRPD